MDPFVSRRQIVEAGVAGIRTMLFVGGLALLSIGVGATTATNSSSGPTTTTTSSSTTTTLPTGTCPVGWPSRAGVTWPCAGTTGVPQAVLTAAGVANAQQLPTYTGPPSITSCGETSSTGAASTGILNGVVSGVFMNGGLDIRAGNGNSDGSQADACVTIKNSYVKGDIDTSFPGAFCTPAPASGICGPVLLTDDEIAPPNCTGSCTDSFAVKGPNQHGFRLNLHNSTHPAFFPDLAYNELRDSYVHAIWALGTSHTAAAAVNTQSTGAYNVFDHDYLSQDVAPGSAFVDPGGFSDSFNIYIQGSNSHDNTVTNNYFTGDASQAGFQCTIADLATTYVDVTGTHGTVYPGTFNSPAGGSWDAWNENWSNNVYDSPNCTSNTPPSLTTEVDAGYMTASGIRNAVTGSYRSNWNVPAAPWVSTSNPGTPHNDKWCNNLTTVGAAVGPSVC